MDHRIMARVFDRWRANPVTGTEVLFPVARLSFATTVLALFGTDIQGKPGPSRHDTGVWSIATADQLAGTAGGRPDRRGNGAGRLDACDSFGDVRRSVVTVFRRSLEYP
jgi:hypothetical protein